MLTKKDREELAKHISEGMKQQAQFNGNPQIQNPTPSGSSGWNWASWPDEIKKRFSPPPERSAFPSTEEYEEARGYWQGRVGRNIGLALQQYRQKGGLNPYAS